MKKEIKDRWLAALRSGEYKQERKQLTINDGYCCLGVLCDLYLKDNNKDWGIEGECEGKTSVLPNEVIVYAGLHDKNPPIKYYGEIDSCIGELNDAFRLSFPEIANLIEEQL